jgi:hypothetical protein
VRLLHRRMLPLTERFLSPSGKQGENDREQEGNVRKASAASVAPIRQECMASGRCRGSGK